MKMENEAPWMCLQYIQPSNYVHGHALNWRCAAVTRCRRFSGRGRTIRHH